MRNKKQIIGAIVAGAMAVILIAGFIAADWNTRDEPEAVPFAPEDGNLPHNSINYVLFEEWGPIMLVLGAVMFGAIIAGVALSKEEDDDEEEEVKQ